MWQMLLIALLGITAGVIAGLFGVGGGIIFVPSLTLLAGMGVHNAVATSLLAIVPVAIWGTWQQRKTGDVYFRQAMLMGIAAAGTAVAGAFIAHHLPEQYLRIGFAGLLLFVAWRMWRDAERRSA